MQSFTARTYSRGNDTTPMINPLLKPFVDFIQKEGASNDTFIVGGAVRDLLFGKELKDIDITIKGNSLLISKRFADAIGGSFVLLDKGYQISRVVKDRQFIDFSPLRGDSIYSDLAGRDITVNAMAIPLAVVIDQLSAITGNGSDSLVPWSSTSDLMGAVIDPFDGRKDMQHRTIRMVSDENLKRDPLRILRLYRFSTTLQFDIEINTINAIREHGALISVTASERIAEELRHIFSSGSSLKTIREMQNDGFLMQLFPELGHFTDEGQHRILQIYNHIELMLGDIPLYFHNEADKISIYFREGSRIACLKLTALFPDMQLSAQVSKRLRLSCKETELMQTIIVNQHKMARLHEMDKREIAHMLLELRDDVYPCLVFLISQHLICQLTEHYLLAACQRMIAFYHSEFITRVSMPPLVNGDDLIETFHLAPSPLFREILYEITLLTLEGAITTRQEAIREIKERWKL